MTTTKKPNAGETAWETRKKIHGSTGKAKPIAASPLMYWKARAETAEAALVEALQIAATLRQMYEDKDAIVYVDKAVSVEKLEARVAELEGQVCSTFCRGVCQ